MLVSGWAAVKLFTWVGFIEVGLYIQSQISTFCNIRVIFTRVTSNYEKLSKLTLSDIE